MVRGDKPSCSPLPHRRRDRGRSGPDKAQRALRPRTDTGTGPVSMRSRGSLTWRSPAAATGRCSRICTGRRRCSSSRRCTGTSTCPGCPACTSSRRRAACSKATGFDVSINVGPGAMAHVTTQSATKVHRMDDELRHRITKARAGGQRLPGTAARTGHPPPALALHHPHPGHGGRQRHLAQRRAAAARPQASRRGRAVRVRHVLIDADGEPAGRHPAVYREAHRRAVAAPRAPGGRDGEL